MRKPVYIALTLLFLAVIFCVPISQAIIDVTVEKRDKPVFLTLYEKAPSEEHLRKFEEELEDKSLYENKVRPLLQHLRLLTLKDAGEKAERTEDGWYFLQTGLDYLTDRYFRELKEPPKTDPSEALVDLAAQLRSKGIRLLVVPVPGKASVHPDRLSSRAVPKKDLSANTMRFIAELRRRKIEVVNLHESFWAARAVSPKTQLYMATDTHWTGAGVEVAARTIAARVRSQGWFKSWRAAHPGIRFTRKQVRVERQGDVPTRMTDIPEQVFPKETVTVHRVFEKKSGDAYEDMDYEEEEAPILLLGDSFSRIFQTDEPESAGLIANLAFTLQATVSSIVNDGGAGTAVRQQLAMDIAQEGDLLEGKKLVIYEFVERDIRFSRDGWKKIALWE
jgi:hypothetical protein